ncbi:hypothetical protein GCM10025866_06260 [Naasia aerilata]|uniref:DUF5060 domain-containing protein n=1 Tax=Naasia aerilata TaxID=1162966 RepID=A0ABN6XLR2_9MICO|nr:hypothetical protein GCM10025866_06260 [Naasia aerilata]
MTSLTSFPSALSADTPVATALRHPQARELLEDALPELRDSAMKMILGGRALGLVIATSPATAASPERTRDLWSRLAALPPVADEHRSPAPAVEPSPEYEGSGVPRGSARARFERTVPLFGRFELVLDGPAHGNPFTDVRLGAVVDTPSRSVEVPGFYDDGGVYRVRYLVEEPGEHRFRTTSTARSLDGIDGSFTVEEPAAGHGPVRVEGAFHFAHADGTRHIPVGTTAYAWTHQGDDLEERTLATLAASPFNKVRMCVFPKSYLFNENEPVRFPFPGMPEPGSTSGVSMSSSGDTSRSGSRSWGTSGSRRTSSSSTPTIAGASPRWTRPRTTATSPTRSRGWPPSPTCGGPWPTSTTS